MEVLVVYAHPNPDSFNHAILDSFTKGLMEGGHTFEVADLYAMDFNPCLSVEDFVKIRAGSSSDDVMAQQEKVSQADGLVFIHPIWWTGLPAILKGWLDRVFSMGYAYAFDEKDGHPIGLLKNAKALIICTAGAVEEIAKQIGSEQALSKIWCEEIIQFCGIKDVRQVVFYNVISTDDVTRKEYLEEARNLGKNF